MSGVYEAYLIRMLAPLGLYDLNGVQNRSELSALGGKLDEVGALLDTVERESLLADVSTALATMHVPITSLVAKELKDRMASIQITCTIENLDQLRFIIGNLSKIAGVERIERANQ